MAFATQQLFEMKTRGLFLMNVWLVDYYIRPRISNCGYADAMTRAAGHCVHAG